MVTTKSWHATSGGGLASLHMEEHAIPGLGDREVLVRVRANSLNAREISVLRGTYPLPVKKNVVMCSDGAGEVVATGPAVSRVRPGDRVAASMFPKWIDGRVSWEYAPQIGGSVDGMLASFVVLDEQALVPVPEHLSFAEAATLPCAAVTAWNALTGCRPLRAGDTVLTLGSGSVSLFALQFARAFGARVIVVTSTREKTELLRQAGANDVVFARDGAQWSQEVRELTSGRGVDQVIEVIGQTLEPSIKATALDGQVNFIGRMAGLGALDSAALYAAVVTVRVVFAGSRRHFQELNSAMEVNALRPILDRSFPFQDAPAAFRYFEAGKGFGKVLIEHD